MADKKEKKYVSDNAQLMAEWDWEKNNAISPYTTTVGSRVSVYWLGSCGHAWEAVIKDRVRGYGCPICAGKRVVEGINDLKSNYPDISAQWHYGKNSTLAPNEIASKSHKRVWWICPKGHEYEASVDSRTRGRGCPYCNSKFVSLGENDLESQNPFLASEYSSKNALPSINSHKKVWWECSSCKHIWEASVDSRNRGNGCPACSARTQSSFPEQAIFYYVKFKHPDAISRFTNLNLGRYELDIFIPSLCIGIEYDGKHWHAGTTSKSREVEKYNACKLAGITLIRIRESSEKTELIADYTIQVQGDLNKTIQQLSQWNLVGENIDVDKDGYEIMSCYLSGLKENSFAAKHPLIASEWCYEKNGGLSPDMFSEFSTNSKFWFKCKKGHHWQSTIAHRTSMRSNCPYCSNRKLLCGYNDLQTVFPNIAKDWHPTRNGDLTPSNVMSGSKKKVWWECSVCKHEWFTSVQSRTRGCGCPECAKSKRKASKNPE